MAGRGKVAWNSKTLLSPPDAGETQISCADNLALDSWEAFPQRKGEEAPIVAKEIPSRLSAEAKSFGEYK
jgi:hypothetical protein